MNNYKDKICLIYAPDLFFDRVIGEFKKGDLLIICLERRFEKRAVELVGEGNVIVCPLANDRVRLGEVLSDCRAVVADHHILQHIKGKNINLRQEVPLFIFSHATDVSPRYYFSSKNYMISASKRCAETSNDFINGCAKINKDAIYRSYYTGLYHVNFQASHESCREKLVNDFGLDPEKPIVTLFIDEFSAFEEVHQGILSLTHHLNVLYKSYVGWLNLYEFSGVKLIEDKSYNDVLRYGSDFVLAGADSGTLVTNAMLGIKTIPYLSKVYFKNCGLRRDVYKLNKDILSESSTRSDLDGSARRFNQKWHRFHDVVSPVFISDTAGILKLIKNSSFWLDYLTYKNAWQFECFGDYHVEDAAIRTKELIMSVLNDEDGHQSYLVAESRSFATVM